MKQVPDYQVVLIGGSAGSIPVISELLQQLPATFKIPVVLIVHRMRNINSQLDVLFSRNAVTRKVVDTEDKMALQKGKVYLAPQNYHLLFEDDKTLSLDYSDPVFFSRPSIDVSFESAAAVFGPATLAILLSGANQDGSNGAAVVAASGGTVWVQDPATAESDVMPLAAVRACAQTLVLTPAEMGKQLQQL